MDIKNIKRVYFIGIGGIGMSALARFFHEQGATVTGFDKTETELTDTLKSEGIAIHFVDDINLVDRNAELIIYTPAIPKDQKELNWFIENKYEVYKRSDVLQWISESLFSITIAGTHGKTTTSTILAYLLRETNYGCSAFLGGISVNYNTNYWGSDNDTAIIEADEYDRSFLKLFPDIAAVTSMDADHLDIYGTKYEMENAYISYTKNIKQGGTLLVKQGINRHSEMSAPNIVTYSLDNCDADVYGANIVQNQGTYTFDIIGKNWRLETVQLNIGGIHNVENAIAAISITHILGIDGYLVRKALANFKGVKRRFEYIVKNEKVVYIDDYAHHPSELSALLLSAKSLFPHRRCVVCFQPHLFSRTRDFADEFASVLDLADEIFLLDIYPARELPIDGVTSNMIADRMKNKEHKVVSKSRLIEYLENNKPDLFITAGAGDIDKLVEPIKNILSNK